MQYIHFIFALVGDSKRLIVHFGGAKRGYNRLALPPVRTAEE